MCDLQLCKNCINVTICRIYECLNTNSHIAETKLLNCKNFRSDNLVEKNDIAESMNVPLLAPKPIKQYQNFKELSKQAKDESKKRKPVVSIIKEDKEEITESEPLTVCKTCGGTTYISDIVPCDKCGKETCSNCRTNVAETGKKLCDTCWSEE